MKRHRDSRRVSRGTAMLLVIGLVFGCQDQSIPVAPNADEPVALKKKVDCATHQDHPSCGGGKKGGNAFTVVMTGGLNASSQLLDSFKENKRQISGKRDVYTVELRLRATQAYAMDTGDPASLPTDCSFTCDDPGLDCAIGGSVYDDLASAFVSPLQPHPTVPTPGYTGLSVGFDKNAVNGPASSNCFFTGIAQLVPPSGGGVVIRNCHVTGNTATRVFTVDADPANTVATGKRYDTDSDGELGPQDYRASLVCPLQTGDEFTVTFAEQP